jgi:hypothetical protein
MPDPVSGSAHRPTGRAEGPQRRHEPIETYSNGVRHVKIPDPDGNAIAFAELPDARVRADDAPTGDVE